MGKCARCGANAGWALTTCYPCYTAARAEQNPAEAAERQAIVEAEVLVSTDPNATRRCPACAEEILAAANKCKHCGEWVPHSGLSGSPAPPAQPPSSSGSGASVFGWLLLAAGIVGLLFSLNMDTSVETGVDPYNSFGLPSRVNNIGLMNQQRNYLIISGIVALAGVVLIVSGTSKKS